MGLTTIGWPSVYPAATAGGKNRLSRLSWCFCRRRRLAGEKKSAAAA